MLELFHFEDCPCFQKARRKLEELDLTYISHPSLPSSKRVVQNDKRRAQNDSN